MSSPLSYFVRATPAYAFVVLESLARRPTKPDGCTNVPEARTSSLGR